METFAINLWAVRCAEGI